MCKQDNKTVDFCELSFSKSTERDLWLGSKEVNRFLVDCAKHAIASLTGMYSVDFVFKELADAPNAMP